MHMDGSQGKIKQDNTGREMTEKNIQEGKIEKKERTALSCVGFNANIRRVTKE